MKHIKLSFLLVFWLGSATSIFGQPVTQKEWTSKERSTFITSCIDAAKKDLGEDTARFYCRCMQSKVEARYPSAVGIDDSLTTETLKSPEWKKAIDDCLHPHSWTPSQRSKFVADCVESAKKNIPENKAL